MLVHACRRAAGIVVERSLPRSHCVAAADADEALEEGVQGDLTDYLDEVGGQLELTQAQAREIVDAVIGSLRLLMTAEEVDAIASQLSPQLSSMWIRASNVPGAPGHSGTP